MDEPLLDKVPGCNLYIGGFISLRRPKALANCKVTHIISVLDWKFADDSPLIRGYKHLHIPVQDLGNENLIEWFPKSNIFIKEGLEYWQNDVQHQGTNEDQVRDPDGRNGVLVHCAMGQSRSATIIIAYLLWASGRHLRSALTSSSAPALHDLSCDDSDNNSAAIGEGPLTPESALTLLRQGRPLAEPNDGFMDQLSLYHSMGCPDNVEGQPKYQRWLYQKHVEERLDTHTAPELDYIRFEDEHEDDADLDPSLSNPQREIEVKCRKCRRLLAKSSFRLHHEPPGGRDEKDCAHLFLHPLSWMKDELAEAQLDGRLVCPNQRCGANIGRFAWQGMRCSCGGWVTPGFALARGRVDEVTALGRTGSWAGDRIPVVKTLLNVAEEGKNL